MKKHTTSLYKSLLRSILLGKILGQFQFFTIRISSFTLKTRDPRTRTSKSQDQVVRTADQSSRYRSKLKKAKVDLGKVFDGIHGHINELDAFLFNNIDLIEKVGVRHVVRSLWNYPVPVSPVHGTTCRTLSKLKSDLSKAESENQRLRAHIAGQR